MEPFSVAIRSFSNRQQQQQQTNSPSYKKLLLKNKYKRGQRRRQRHRDTDIDHQQQARNEEQRLAAGGFNRIHFFPHTLSYFFIWCRARISLKIINSMYSLGGADHQKTQMYYAFDSRVIIVLRARHTTLARWPHYSWTPAC